jgi:hypothetical protein
VILFCCKNLLWQALLNWLAQTISNKNMYTQSSFSCFIIGEGTLPIQCAELLLERGHEILGVISPEASISSWAKGKDIPHIQQTDNLVAFLSQ